MDDAELEQRLARALAPRDEVLEAYLFGSQASGLAQAHSSELSIVEEVLKTKLDELDEFARRIEDYLGRA